MSTSLAWIEDSVIRQVGQPFQRSISALHEVIKIIEFTGVSASPKEVGEVSTFLRKHAEDAWLNMKEAENNTNQIKCKLEHLIQNSINNKRMIEQDVDKFCSELVTYNKRLESLEKEKDQVERELSLAKASFQFANNILSDAEDKLKEREDEQEKLTNPPTWAWFVSPIGAGIGVLVGKTFLEKKVDEARESVESAQENERNAIDRLNDKLSQMSVMEETIERGNLSIKDLEIDLFKKEEEIKNLIQQLDKQTKLDEEVAKCSTFVAVAFGRVSNGRDAALALYTFEALVESLKKCASYFNSTQLPQSDLFKRAVDFAQVESKLKMICGKGSIKLADDDIDNYA